MTLRNVAFSKNQLRREKEAEEMEKLILKEANKMPKFLIEYTHIEETTYEQWIEANSKEEALKKIEEKANFQKVTNVQGIELKYKVVEEK